MSGLLLDTNHLGLALNSGSEVHRRIIRAREQGSRLGTCIPVVCELAAGIEQSMRRDENWKALPVLLGQLRLWPLDVETASLYGRIHVELRAKGRVLSSVDMMLAALARQLDLTIVTTDRDFEALPDIRVENWLAG